MRYLFLILSLFLFLACDNEGPSREYSKDIAGSYEDFELTESQAENAPSPQEVATKIIKTANLRYQTQDLDKTKNHITTAIKNAQGYIQNDNSGKDYNQLYQRMTVRVPSKNFEQALQAIGQGVSHFEERTISQQDVTEEFVDLNARLKAKRALEDRYLNLLSKAKNVKEMLEIERELSQIREEIEAKQGRLKYLSSQVSQSTIHIHFYKVTIDEGITQSYGSKMVNALKSGWNGISVFFLGLLHLWPFLILLGVVGYFVRRKMKKKKA